jgi:hypothetical protein
MAIYFVVASRSFSTCKFGKKMRSMQHIDIIERSWQTKKNSAKSTNDGMLLPQAQYLDHGFYFNTSLAMPSGNSSIANACNLNFQACLANLSSHSLPSI